MPEHSAKPALTLGKIAWSVALAMAAATSGLAVLSNATMARDAYWAGQFIGGFIGALLLPLLLAYIVWYLSGRRNDAARVIFLVMLVLGLFAQLGRLGTATSEAKTRRQLGAAYMELNQSILTAAMDVGFTRRDVAARLLAYERRFDELTSPQRGIDPLRGAIREHYLDILKRELEYAAVLHEVFGGDVINVANLYRDGELARCRAMLRNMIEAGRAYEQHIDSLPARLEARLKDHNVDPRRASEIVSGTRNDLQKHVASTKLLLKARAEWAGAVDALYDHVARSMSRSRVAADGLIEFDDEADRSRFEALAKRVDAGTDVLVKLEEGVMKELEVPVPPEEPAKTVAQPQSVKI